MPMIYWSKKKAPLTPEEVDGNFEYLEQKIHGIQEDLKEIPALTAIEVKEGKLLCKGSDGSDLSPIKLPSWTPRGQWKSDTPYEQGDVVYDEKALYLCQSGSINVRPCKGAHWVLIFSLNAP